MAGIDEALMLHAKIKDQLKSAVRNPHGIDPQSIRTDRTCAFGQWIYGADGVQFAAHREFHDLKDTHRRFHESAYHAMCLCRTGKVAQAEESITTGAFERLSKDMVERLKAMQRVIDAITPGKAPLREPALDPVRSGSWQN